MSDSPVLLLFVGVHKALETVNCSILLLKLDDRGTHLTPYNYELGKAKFGFNIQQFCISCGNELSKQFRPNHGLRQVGVLSSMSL